MKLKLMGYYFALAAISLGLFSIENNELRNKMSGESKPAMEAIERRPVEPNNKPEEKEQVETKKSRPSVSYRSSQLC